MSSLRPDDADRPRSFGRAARVQDFFTADLKSVALFRIVLGVLLICDTLVRFSEVEALYSNDGVLTNHFSLFRPLGPHQFSLFVGFSSTRDMAFLFGVCVVVYALFTLGYRTRLFQALSFICVTSLHSRNLMAEVPGDVALHVLVAWSFFLPVGARFSIHALRRSLLASDERTADELNVPLSVPRAVNFHRSRRGRTAARGHASGPRISSARRRLARGNGALLHFAPRCVGHPRGELAARQRLAVIDRTALVRLPLGRDRHRLFGAGPFVYARRLAIVLLLLFHLASRALWNIGLYDWIVLGGLPLLLSTHDWDVLTRWYARKKPRLTVYFDADCGVCLAICRFLKRLDGLSRLTFVAGSSEEAPADVRALASETVVVQGETGGSLFVKARAVSAIFARCRSCPLLPGPFERPGLAKLAERAYDRFAQNRAAISVFFGYEACGVGHAKEEPRVAVGKTSAPWSVWGREIAAGLFLLLCSAALVRGTEDLPVATGLESSLQTAVAYPRIFQQWNLFAPEPPRRQGVVIVEGLTSQGHHVDPLTGSEPSVDVDPARLATLSPYMAADFASISLPSHAMYLDGLREHIKHRGDQREAGDKLSSFTVNWVEQKIAPPPGEAQVEAAQRGDLVLRKRLTSFP